MRTRSLTTLGILIAISAGFYLAVYFKTVWTQSPGNPHLFFHPDNISNILGQAAIVGILASGMTLVMIAGHIDLSVGSMLGMLGAVAAWLMSPIHGWGWDPLTSLTGVVFLGSLLGAGHGAMVAWLRMPSFVVTLGGLLAYRGVLLLVARRTIPIDAQWIRELGSGVVPLPFLSAGSGLPIRFLLMLVLAAGTYIVATRFRFGRYLYAIGGNPQAAHYSGIRIHAYLVGVFALMGAVAALAGVVSVGVQMAADPGAGDLMELYAIAACVIGGTSLAGGRGTVWGSILGALIMAVIRNGLSCLGVANAGEKIVLGVILVAAVGLDKILSRHRST